MEGRTVNNIASELSYLVWLKQQREQGKPEVSKANREKFPVQPPKQTRPAWFSDFSTTHGGR